MSFFATVKPFCDCRCDDPDQCFQLPYSIAQRRLARTTLTRFQSHCGEMIRVISHPSLSSDPTDRSSVSPNDETPHSNLFVYDNKATTNAAMGSERTENTPISSHEDPAKRSAKKSRLDIEADNNTQILSKFLFMFLSAFVFGSLYFAACVSTKNAFPILRNASRIAAMRAYLRTSQRARSVARAALRCFDFHDYIVT